MWHHLHPSQLLLKLLDVLAIMHAAKLDHSHYPLQLLRLCDCHQLLLVPQVVAHLTGLLADYTGRVVSGYRARVAPALQAVEAPTGAQESALGHRAEAAMEEFSVCDFAEGGSRLGLQGVIAKRKLVVHF